MVPRTSFRDASIRRWRYIWLLVMPLAGLAMLGWLRPGMPTSPRGENVPQIAYLWLLRRLWASGDALGGWNPLVLAGEPTATARLYHLHSSLAGLSLLLNITPELIFKAVQLIANVLGALGCYALARKLEASPLASLSAAAAFLFLPIRVMLTAESLYAALATAGTPWLLYGYEQTRVPGPLPRREAVVWGLIVGMSILVGPQRVLVMAAPMTVYILAREICQPIALQTHGRALARRTTRLIVIAGIAFVVAAGLSLFATLPTLIESDQLWTSTYVEAYPRTARWRVAPALVVRLLWQRWSPSFEPFAWNEIGIFPNVTYHLGAALAVLTLLGIANRRRWRGALPLLAMLGLSLMLAFGPNISPNPAYAVMRRLPLLADTVRNAFRYLLPAGLAMSLLTALAVDGLLTAIRQPGAQVALAIAALCLIVVDFWPITSACGVTDGYLGQDTVAIYEAMEALPGNDRLWAPFQLERPGQHYADTSYLYRYTSRSAVSDDAYHTPSAPVRASRLYIEGLQKQVDVDPPLDASAETILDLSAARYMVLATEPTVYAETANELAERPGWRILTSNASAALLENTDALPLAHAYTQGVEIPDLDDANLLDVLPELASRNIALVESANSQPVLASLCASASVKELADLDAQPRADVSLSMARPKANEVWIRYEAASPCLLMLSETWYPHWRVTVDGIDQPLLRLNGSFLGVGIAKAGEGMVVFRYREPWYVWLCRGSSLAALAVCVVVLIKPRPVRLRHDA